MARSPASRGLALAASVALIACASAAIALRWLPFAATTVIELARSHRTGAGAAWEGADRVYAEIDRRTRGASFEARTHIARTILEEARRAELAPLLVLAVIHVESGFDSRAVSPAGAVGLMQLMPATFHAELARSGARAADLLDPVANVRAGVRYLSRLVSAFQDVQLALMAYNAGPNRIRRHLSAGPIPERFHAYPRHVLRQVERLSPLSGDHLAALAPSGAGARGTRAETGPVALGHRGGHGWLVPAPPTSAPELACAPGAPADRAPSAVVRMARVALSRGAGDAERAWARRRRPSPPRPPPAPRRDATGVG